MASEQATTKRSGEGDSASGRILEVGGMVIAVSNHAIARYRERVRPALTDGRVLAEIRDIAQSHGAILAERPQWSPSGSHSDAYLSLGEDVVLALQACRKPEGGWFLTATTCLSRSSANVEVARILRRQRQAQRRRRSGGSGTVPLKAGYRRRGSGEIRRDLHSLGELPDSWR